MSQSTFIFKHFIIKQDRCAMKVGTDAMILGAWTFGRAKSGIKKRTESGRAESDAFRILDIGTGTGVLSLMLAQSFSPLSGGRGVWGEVIDAVEIDENSFLQAKENVENSSWRNRIHVYHSSLQEFALHEDKKYDLIISNPPYFEHNRKASVESDRYKDRTNARSFDKLSFSDLLIHSTRLLSESGQFYVIIPFAAADSFISEAEKNQLFISERLNIHSKENQEPVRVILGFVKIKAQLKEGALVIYEDDGNYTNDYIELTKDFHARDMRPQPSLS